MRRSKTLALVYQRLQHISSKSLSPGKLVRNALQFVAHLALGQDVAQSLSGLVSNHAIQIVVRKSSLERLDRSFALNLAQHVGYFVRKYGTLCGVI